MNNLNNKNKLIHLLYVPTMFCNLGCQYCYLGSQTDRIPKSDEKQAIETLTFALDKLLEKNVLPFNVSLHGGEVTCLPSETLDKLFKIIERHYMRYLDELHANNFRKVNPHIKTNLYNFDNLYELMCLNKVSISASIDLPLLLHKKYRTTKSGQATLERTLKNLTLLGKYPYNAKISSTLFDEHLNDPAALIEDIWFIHKEIGFDMNNFNFMFGFNAALNNEKLTAKGRSAMLPVAEEKQVQFYQKMKAEFLGTSLEYGFRRNWFDEFMPSYCTCSENCGDRFLLLQADGNMYSCVRGQGVEAFHYGNIYTDEVETILERAKSKIADVHQKTGFDEDCMNCDYLTICHSGCPFVKNETHTAKSYTCALQKEIYKDNPASYPPAKNKEQQQLAAKSYLFKMHPHLVKNEAPTKNIKFKLPNDLYEPKNKLQSMIDEDLVLKALYSPDNFVLEFNNHFYPMSSQILKVERTILNIFSADTVKLHIKKSVFEANSREPLTNTLFLQLLRDTIVVYGDEKRSKQEHIFTYQIYRNLLAKSKSKGPKFLEYDLTGILNIHGSYFLENVINNLLVTTESLRSYHYQKHKLNAFYHIQAINLPFQNVEFYWNNYDI